MIANHSECKACEQGLPHAIMKVCGYCDYNIPMVERLAVGYLRVDNGVLTINDRKRGNNYDG